MTHKTFKKSLSNFRLKLNIKSVNAYATYSLNLGKFEYLQLLLIFGLFPTQISSLTVHDARNCSHIKN